MSTSETGAPNRIYLVRHGRTAWNQARRYTGQTDLPLDGEGRRQAERLSARIASIRFDAAYAGDLLRARETAERILADRDVPLVLEKRLREAAFGLWEGLTFDEVRARYPDELTNWLADPSDAAPSGGESLDTLTARVTEALREILDAGVGRTLLLVTHGGPARVILCAALGLAPGDHWRFSVEPGGLAIIEFYGRKGILCGLESFPPNEESPD